MAATRKPALPSKLPPAKSRSSHLGRNSKRPSTRSKARTQVFKNGRGSALPFLFVRESVECAMRILSSTRKHVWVQLLLLGALSAQSDRPGIFAEMRRLSDAPIISPRGDSWESAGTFNPAVVERGEKIMMLYRAQDKEGTSRLGYAEGVDGIHFTRRDQPVLSPEAPYEKDGGIEDPRLVKFGETYYLTYTGYNKTDAQLCLATSKDLVHWNRKG